ncbi:MAG: hypothetical protein JXR76_15910 [Deltaproteobacteria bacterium]|nr:hypothetical protein [Deltaproteobacteria bacterium]
MKKKFAPFGVSLIMVLMVFPASVLAKPPNVAISAGIKGAVGGNHMAAKDASAEIDEDAYFEAGGAPFEREIVGSGGGGGIFGEVRFFNGHLGVELNLLFDVNRARCAVVQTDGVDVDYILTYSMLRVPLLLKAAFTRGRTRMGIGIGPEFRFGLTAKTDLEIIDGERYRFEDQLSAWKSNFSAQKRDDVAIAWDVAMAFDLYPFEITVDLRVSHVLTYPDAFHERVEIDGTYKLPTIRVQSTHAMDGRILLGMAYIFQFL